MNIHEPLHGPARTLPAPADLGTEITITHRILDETAALNTGDLGDMQEAAFALNRRLRSLLAAIETERGEYR